MGNIITVCRVIRQKLFLSHTSVVRFQLSRKYSFARPQIAQAEVPAAFRRRQEENDSHVEDHMETADTKASSPENVEMFTSKEEKKTLWFQCIWESPIGNAVVGSPKSPAVRVLICTKI